jgi:uncharacterized protein (TIRG00374 family)
VKHWWRLLFPALILSFLIARINIEDFLAGISTANPSLICIALVSSFMLVILQGIRWYVLSLKYSPRINLYRILLLNFTAMSFDSFVPGKLGSDSYRLIESSKGGSKSEMLGILMFLRMQTVVLGFLLTVAVFLTMVASTYSLLILCLGLLCFALVIAAPDLRPRGCFEKLAELSILQSIIPEKFRSIFAVGSSVFFILLKDTGQLLVSSSLLLLYFISNALLFWIVSQAFSIDTPFTTYLISAPVILFMSNAPFTIQGRGVTELVALYFWGRAGVSTEQVLLVCFVVYGFSVFHSLCAGWTLFITRILQKARCNERG